MKPSETASKERLRRRLEGVLGLSLERDVELAPLTTLRIGGAAEILATVHSEEALMQLFEQATAAGIPVLMLGMGSNVLVPDEGVPGVVVRLSGEFASYEVEGDQVECGAAVSLARLARATVSEGLLGLEALGGFPSSVGGAVYMNAGCYGVEIKDLLLEAVVVEADGSRRRVSASELGAGYRSTALQGTGCVVTRAVLQLERGDPGEGLRRLQELNKKRRHSLPSGRPNAGSIFRNPPDDFAGRLIEECGLKGERRGGASISRRHANVIVNAGDARAEDVLALMLQARREVLAKYGVELLPEIVLTGSLAQAWRSSS